MVTVNNTNYTATGTYQQMLTNSMGCDSLLIINVTINTVDALVSVAGYTLTANALGATYQWVNCNIGSTPIPLATNQIFVATVNGAYAVIVSDNGCIDTSSCFTIFGFGVNNISDQNNVTIIPNPTNNGTFSLSIENLQSTDLSIDIFDLHGRLLYRRLVGQTTNNIMIPFSLPELAAGSYIIKLSSDRNFIQKIFIVSK